MPATTGRGGPRNLILTAMIFAVSMMFIDMTIISIAVPPIQRDLGLSTIAQSRGGGSAEPGESGTVPGSQAPHEEAGARP